MQVRSLLCSFTQMSQFKLLVYVFRVSMLVFTFLRTYSYDRERNIPEHASRVAPRFQDGLKAFAKSSPIIGEV